MNAFEQARTVEARGMAVLAPYLTERSDGRLVLFNKGPLARAMQERSGDAAFMVEGDRTYFVEIKVEQANKYGNLFLETWSNRNLADRDKHAARGSNPGWLHKLVADLLFYYFLDNDDLYVFDLFKLKQWAFVTPGASGNAGRLFDYEEKPQSRYQQANDTYGRCVPIADLRRDVGCRLLHPKQFNFAFVDEGLVA